MKPCAKLTSMSETPFPASPFPCMPVPAKRRLEGNVYRERWLFRMTLSWPCRAPALHMMQTENGGSFRKQESKEVTHVEVQSQLTTQCDSFTLTLLNSCYVCMHGSKLTSIQVRLCQHCLEALQRCAEIVIEKVLHSIFSSILL